MCVEPVVAGAQSCQNHLAWLVKKVVCILLLSGFQHCFGDGGLFLVIDAYQSLAKFLVVDDVLCWGLFVVFSISVCNCCFYFKTVIKTLKQNEQLQNTMMCSTNRLCVQELMRNYHCMT